MNDFEHELESELHRILDSMTGVSIPARRVTDSGGTMNKLLGGAGAALGVKILTGFAVAAAAATFAVAATEVATTGSVNPANWGQQVKTQVDVCKDKLAAGQHGIGECVSSFANKHGDAVSDSHASKARTHGDSDKTGNGKDKSKSHGQGDDKSQPSRPETTSTPEQNVGGRR